jgi:uncharacterized protein with HEPN domain
MPLSPLEYLRHIQDEAEYLAARMKGMSKENFMRDQTVKRAFVRSIEIIGEAAKRVPPGHFGCLVLAWEGALDVEVVRWISS